jgi:hypothetical protein
MSLQIDVEGGTVQAFGQWTDGEVTNKYWIAQSEHTGEMEKFYTLKAAEFFCWVINERIVSMRFRGVIG